MRLVLLNELTFQASKLVLIANGLHRLCLTLAVVFGGKLEDMLNQESPTIKLSLQQDINF